MLITAWRRPSRKQRDWFLVDTLTQAIAYRPEFILWVAAPHSVDESALWQAGDIFKDMDYYPALGIISGGTMEIAEQLWRNGQLTRNGENYLGSDVEVDQGVLEALIVDLNQPEDAPLPLTHDTLVQTLPEIGLLLLGAPCIRYALDVGYHCEAGGGRRPERRGGSCFMPNRDPDTQLRLLPTLERGFDRHGIHQPGRGGLSRSCADCRGQQFLPDAQGLYRPGYVHLAGIPAGHFSPGAQTAWKRTFPPAPPLYFMLGDPRAYLSAEQPYIITADEVNGTTRRIMGETDFRGYLSVKVADGADYDFVRVSGLAAASESDFFFNNDLQTLNLGGDKYLVFYQDRDTFEVVLTEKTPWYWPVWDGLVDALDYNWVTMNTVYNPFSLVFLAGLVILLLVKTRRKKYVVKKSLERLSRLLHRGLRFSCPACRLCAAAHGALHRQRGRGRLHARCSCCPGIHWQPSARLPPA